MKAFLEKYVYPIKNLHKKWDTLDQNGVETHLLAIICILRLMALLAPYFEDHAKTQILEKICWTLDEMCSRKKMEEKGKGVTAWKALVTRVHNSVAGQFISEFNKGVVMSPLENELKLQMYKKSSNFSKDHCIQRNNDIVDDLVKLITKIISSTPDNESISLSKFLGHLNHLRLTNSKIQILDVRLSRLNTLQILVLYGNLIETMPLNHLPKTLRVLEIGNNLITDINFRDQNIPPLLYLGLDSNCISDTSNIDSILFLKTLLILDLGNNNIVNIDGILRKLSGLNSLICLSLKGNPCSTIVSYKDIIVSALPKIQQIDGIGEIEKSVTGMLKPIIKPSKETSISTKTIIKTPKKIIKEEYKKKFQEIPPTVFNYCAELRIYVYRLMGIPRPKKKGYYQFEVELPLLDDKLVFWEKCHCVFELLRKCNIIPKIEEIKPNLAVSEQTFIKFNDDKKGLKKTESWEIKYHHFLSNDKEQDGVKKIMSEKINWSLIMKPFKAIVVMPIEINKLSKLRDTLRTIISIRLFYKEESIKSIKHVTETNVTKTLLAKIPVPAQIPIWNEEYCGYEWSAKDPFEAIPSPGVSKMKFIPGLKVSRQTRKSQTFPVPTYPVCHIGISLLRR